MDAPVEQSFDYSALDPGTRAFVRERAERIHNLARMTRTGIVQIGQYLTEVKERLKHGQFLKWIGAEFAWKQSVAYNFMQVFQNVKVTNFVNLAVDVSALYVIAAPKTPEPVREDALRRASNGEVVSHSGARALVRQFAETGQLPEVDVSLKDLVEARRARKTVIEAAPVETEEDEEARAEQEQLRARMKLNSQRMQAVMAVITAIECLSGAELEVPQIAKAIRQLDTPDKDWHGQTEQARRTLTALCRELKA